MGTKLDRHPAENIRAVMGTALGPEEEPDPAWRGLGGLPEQGAADLRFVVHWEKQNNACSRAQRPAGWQKFKKPQRDCEFAVRRGQAGGGQGLWAKGRL